MLCYLLKLICAHLYYSIKNHRTEFSLCAVIKFAQSSVGNDELHLEASFAVNSVRDILWHNERFA